MNLINNLTNINAYSTEDRNLIGQMAAVTLQQLIAQLVIARPHLILCDKLELVTVIDNEIQFILQDY